MKDRLTSLEAFKAMQLFLEGYYKRTGSEDIGSLLGDLQLLQDHETFDPAAWDDWIKSVNLVLSRKSSAGNIRK